MKKFLAKIWKTKFSVFSVILYAAILFSSLVEQQFSSNYLASMFAMVGITFTASTYWVTYFITAAISLIFFTIIVKVYWILFGFIYARSFSGRVASVSELPIGRVDFPKFIFMFAIVTNTLVGILRLFILIDYNAYFLINYVCRPIVCLSVALIAFLVMKKYLLEGKIAYNTFLALSLPYMLYMIFTYAR